MGVWRQRRDASETRVTPIEIHFNGHPLQNGTAHSPNHMSKHQLAQKARHRGSKNVGQTSVREGGEQSVPVRSRSVAVASRNNPSGRAPAARVNKTTRLPPTLLSSLTISHLHTQIYTTLHNIHQRIGSTKWTKGVY